VPAPRPTPNSVCSFPFHPRACYGRLRYGFNSLPAPEVAWKGSARGRPPCRHARLRHGAARTPAAPLMPARRGACPGRCGRECRMPRHAMCRKRRRMVRYQRSIYYVEGRLGRIWNNPEEMVGGREIERQQESRRLGPRVPATPPPCLRVATMLNRSVRSTPSLLRSVAVRCGCCRTGCRPVSARRPFNAFSEAGGGRAWPRAATPPPVPTAVARLPSKVTVHTE